MKMRFIKSIYLILFCMASCLIRDSFAVQTEEYTAEISFAPSGIATSFELHSSKTGDNPVGSIGLISTGKTLGSAIKYTAGKIYIQINAGDDNWVLLMCTTFPASSTAMTDLLHTSNKWSLKWKYRNSYLSGEDVDPLGAEISTSDWADPVDPKYRNFLNSQLGCSAIYNYGNIALINFVTIADYEDVIMERIQLTFGIDLSTSTTVGKYSTTVQMELFTN